MMKDVIAHLAFVKAVVDAGRMRMAIVKREEAVVWSQ